MSVLKKKVKLITEIGIFIDGGSIPTSTSYTTFFGGEIIDPHMRRATRFQKMRIC
jgi:hypothetical protein